MLSLLVVEDHLLVREGLVRTLNRLGPDVIISEAGDCDVASALLEQGKTFDLILLDLGLPWLDGLSYLSVLRKRYPHTRVVILSGFDAPQVIEKAIHCGASGFIPKTCSGDDILGALRQVLEGRIVVPEPNSDAPGAASLCVPNWGNVVPSDFGLTKRQAEVLNLMAHGKSNRDIAHLLGLSEGTVKIHLTAIFKALHVSSRTQAMVTLARKGWPVIPGSKKAGSALRHRPE